jgi:hypothetical protein
MKSGPCVPASATVCGRIVDGQLREVSLKNEEMHRAHESEREGGADRVSLVAVQDGKSRSKFRAVIRGVSEEPCV